MTSRSLLSQVLRGFNYGVEECCGTFIRSRLQREQSDDGDIRRDTGLSDNRSSVNYEKVRAIGRLQYAFQKAGGRLFFEVKTIVGTAAYVDQQCYIERHLVGVTDLCNLLRAAFLVQTKIASLQTSNRLACGSRGCHRNHYQIRANPNDVEILI